MLEELLSTTIAMFLALFPIANPIGAIPIFYGLTASNSPDFRQQQALKTAINVVLVLVIFLIAGRFILQFFGLSLGVLKIAGGLLVSHTAWEMVTARQRLTPMESQAASDKEDISMTPMAIPLISGPGAIGVVIGQAEINDHWEAHLGSFLGILGLGCLLYFCLFLGEPLLKALGKNEIGALNRILGFFILAIAVQMISSGVLALLRPVLAPA